MLEGDTQVQFFEMSRFGDDGVLVAAVRKSGQRWVVEAFELSHEGKLRRGPEVVTESPSEILWLATHPTPSGARLFWAERGERGADLHAQMVSLGPTDAASQSLVQGAIAWQFVAGPAGSALATTEGKAASAEVVLRMWPEDSASPPKRVVVARDVVGGIDLDLEATQDAFVAAFSEVDGNQQRLVSARIEPQSDAPPKKAFLSPPRGEQALVRLVNQRSRKKKKDEVLFVWEEPQLGTRAARELLVASAPGGTTLPGPEASLAVQKSDELLPTFSSSDEGLVAVTLAEACPADDDSCGAGNAVPMMVQAQSDFSASAEPVLLSQLSDTPAEMVWDLSCNPRGCFALAADGGSPATAFVVDVAAPSGYQAPLAAMAKQPLPHVVRREELGEVKELADMEAMPSSDGMLLSWVSFFDPSTPYERPTRPAPDGRMAPERAHLVTQRIAEDNHGQKEIAEQSVISYRARSLGGVSLSDARDGQRLLGWAALDGKEPQVFATLLDDRGRKVSQRMLTQSAGEVTDVAVGRVGDGFIVAWTDGRGDSVEIYALRLDAKLQAVGTEQKISRGAESPTGLILAGFQDDMLLVWADSRGAERRGYADLFAVSLDAATAEAKVAPRRLAATAEHSHSPRLAKISDSRWVLGWIEADPDAEAGGQSRLLLAELGPDGRFSSSARASDLPGSVRSFDLHCDANRCRVVLALEVSATGQLWAGLWTPAGLEAHPVASLVGPPLESAPLQLVDDELLYVDRQQDGQNLLHSLSLAWERPGTASVGEKQ